mmetsp:Transcript_10256/g.22808  ORF Transcript_10256/g.22808 Transcript_10256/m.22808 type:complete len:613 (-) Transcript_10256:224-2062(-)|eukprot:CAMPEP_0172318176 /NCGR_PEP_ID=MMETSP1058-20130122/34040_1 /TAXON_ID=83371 /ORGANISM="Detonula confervacea, Strain CCMP 353" /LENGTH=612 /DNA_ID=CAMNT_0013032929 /DNA_START=235 /DNA_END=2076 /DNA_ORIENTATION=+
MLLPKLQIALGVIAAALGISTTKAFQLKDRADYEVKRDLLEKSYPAYESFHGAMHAGLMPAALMDDKSAADDFSSYFFWLFQPDVEASSDTDEQTDESFRNDTLIIWFNGGPGCSSMVGLMGEMGPVGIQKFRPGIPAPNPATLMDAPLVANPFAWTKKSAMLFVEQPGGTGFSTASTEWTGDEVEKRTEDDVASAFYAFLQNIYTVFGEDLSEKKLYLAGESYAGMYIPSIARGIHLRNKRVISKDEGYRSPSLHTVNLRGAAIGNGWIDPKVQGPAAIDFAWWHGMIDLQTYRGLHVKWDECMNQQILDSSEEPFHPFTTPDECGIQDAIMEASGNKFLYDVTTNDAYPAVLNKGGTISNFFNDPVIRESINAPSLQEHPYWLSCVPGSGRRRRLERAHHKSSRKLLMLDNDRPLSVVPYISELLDDAHLDILMYNGDLDLACNAQSTEMALESMKWSGAEGWMDPDTTKWQQWTVEGQPSGHTKRFNNLQFLVVKNSGHFVPINQARHALNMIGRLLDGNSIGDQELASFPAQSKKDVEVNSTDEGQTTAMTHSFSLLTGLCGFLLGVLVSHFVGFVGKRSASRKYSVSSSSSSFQATEETPLHHHAEA